MTVEHVINSDDYIKEVNDYSCGSYSSLGILGRVDSFRLYEVKHEKDIDSLKSVSDSQAEACINIQNSVERIIEEKKEVERGMDVLNVGERMIDRKIEGKEIDDVVMSKKWSFFSSNYTPYKSTDSDCSESLEEENLPCVVLFGHDIMS